MLLPTLLSLSLIPAHTAAAGTGGVVRLLFYDRTGREMDAEQAMKVINAHGWENDTRVDPVTLENLETGNEHPLEAGPDGRLAFPLLARPVGLAVGGPPTRRATR